jgi:NAD(P)-dependent dehydrogenase (short-subunit alcohol dehydrogenase family)
MTAQAETATTQLRHVVIVGGASGIGAATAKLLASRRWRVTIADIDRELGRATAENIGGTFVLCDVGDEASIREAADAADSNHPVSGMVMCAAVFEEIGRAEDASIEVLDAVFRIGYRGTFLSNWVFAQRMARRGGGAIVNLSSFGGLISSPSYSYGPMDLLE